MSDSMSVGPTFIQRMSVELVGDIREYDYYQSIFADALRVEGITVDQVTNCELTDIELCDLWNTMWIRLPDHPAIRRTPFLLLCDLCEYPEQ